MRRWDGELPHRPEHDPERSDQQADGTEIIDIVPGLPDGAGEGGERNDDLLMLGEFNIDHINDPVYQALVATGLFRPR